MVNDPDDRTDPIYSGTAGRDLPPDRERRRSGLWWLVAAAIAIVLLILLMRGCDTAERTAVVDPDPTVGADTTARMGDAGDPMIAAEPYERASFDRYLAGSEAVGRAYALDRVTFASGSSEIDAAARTEIAEIAGVLERYPNSRVEITGFADPEGDAAANQTLSRQRAEAVRAALGDAGAAAGQVALAAEGETGSAAVRANRKVEVRVTAR